MAELIRVEQVVPDDFAELLRDMRRTSGPDASRRLNATLALAHANGWTWQSMADALGVSRQAVEQRAIKALPTADLPPVPLPPRRPTPVPNPPPARLKLKPEQIAELCEMQAVAKSVNGGTPTHAPERRVSEHLSRQLAAYVGQGMAVNYLATVLGVTPLAVRARLGRHGLGTLPPSFAARRDQTYRNRPTYPRRESAA